MSLTKGDELLKVIYINKIPVNTSLKGIFKFFPQILLNFKVLGKGNLGFLFAILMSFLTQIINKNPGYPFLKPSNSI